MSWGEMVVDVCSSCMVDGYWRCLRCVDAAQWCVNCAAGPPAFSSFCLLSLSLYPRCSVPLPLVAFFFFCLTDQLTGSSDSTTGDDDCDDDDGDGAAPCWSLHSCAAAAARPCVCDGCWECWRCVW
ncbi:hypothetical protein Tc00.1047053509225.21 [Trypanosoma cruzi]|uniref:Uncharacterized protein n=1 Tax=Trypanosoma cruzi (strain CL Brener) TaxID=353153 RepID=Q4CPI6_TRYCC|nr:hypothetical protein Tc00.1047053509225.21 [Trypanosoma cruzi]EAN82189.1 hypothetical protein Tc00.1047053509225.21 [Trypanosoma cruzi]|eukprot:XP_804040.1 hypothetical protein [Trypanosoma cruzi strain CL Brener]